MSDFSAFDKYKCIKLTTYRKSGQGVDSPVWFVQEGDKLYVDTEPETGKVKRLRNNPQALICPCTFGGKSLGDNVSVKAAFVTGDIEARVEQLMAKRYGFVRAVLRFFTRLRTPDFKSCYLELTPS